jgi:hypothetical protein
MKRKMDHPCHRQQGPAFSSSKDLSTHLLFNMQSPVSKWLKSGKHRPLTLETFGTETGGVAQCGMNIETRKIPQTLREESLYREFFAFFAGRSCWVFHKPAKVCFSYQVMSSSD